MSTLHVVSIDREVLTVHCDVDTHRFVIVSLTQNNRLLLSHGYCSGPRTDSCHVCTGFPVKQRVVFKLVILVFESLHVETPWYLADDWELITDSGRRRLRSADANALTVPRTYTRLGDRSFSVAGPKVWNSLPATLRKPNIEFVQFKRFLKTFLFVLLRLRRTSDLLFIMRRV